MPMKYASLQERIIANSVQSQDHSYKGVWCWIWTGATVLNRSGVRYGKMLRRVNGKLQTELVHRVAVRAFTKRTLTRRHVVMHLCNLPLCCNPLHLAGGTQAKNMQQCVADGRHKNGHSK